jgi:hypothetical protein
MQRPRRRAGVTRPEQGAGATHRAGMAVDAPLAAVRIVPVQGRAARTRFLDLPHRLYRDDPNWVPPLRFERRRFLDPRHNPYFAQAEVALWLACRGNRTVGRISAQIDRRAQSAFGMPVAQFGFLEAEDDPQVFAALLGMAADWARARGARALLGPFSFSINDECGLLIAGFDRPPTLMMGHSRPYYVRRVEEQGFAKARDLIAYDYDLAAPLPPRAERLLGHARSNSRLRFRSLRRYAEDVRIVVEIFNDAWAENWGFVPFSSREMRHLAAELRPLVMRDLVCIAEVEGEPAAMAIAVPDLNAAIADFGGRLLPLNWARLLWRLRLRRPRAARLLLMGVRRTWRQTPLSAALAFGVIAALREGGLKHGFRRAELSWILEDNTAMRHMIEALGGVAYKTYRIYRKELA